MAFDLFGVAGSGTTTPTVSSSQPRLAEDLSGNTVIVGGQTGPYFTPQTYSGGPTYASGLFGPVQTSFGPYPTTTTTGTLSPTRSAAQFAPEEQTATPSIGLGVGFDATQPLNVGRVPNMPEGYGYANGFPFRGNQVPGWNIGSGAGAVNQSDANSYKFGGGQTPVKFNEQGKEKGLTPNSVMGKSMAQAALEQYGRGSQTYNPYWNALYNAYGGNMLPDTFNPLVQSTLDYYKMGIPDASPTMLPDTYMGMANRWLQQNTTGRQLPDTLNFQQGRLAQQLTALLKRNQTQQDTTKGGSTGTKKAYYGGGGGGGWGGYSSGGGYSPSWYNGLLSWRI